MSFELTGNVILKEDVVEISASFKKREFVIEVINQTNQDWNDFVKIQLTQDRCSLIDPINIGDEVRVNINIKGRKWEKDGKVNYFNSIEGWRLEKLSGTFSQSAPPAEQPPSPDSQSDTNNLPF